MDFYYYPVDDFGLESGSIYEVLRRIPLVEVADDGTISIRGSTSTQVMIDGRPASPGGDYQPVVQQSIWRAWTKYDAITSGTFCVMTNPYDDLVRPGKRLAGQTLAENL